MQKRLIAFKGDRITIEWYFNDLGNSNALKYYNKLPNEDKMLLINLFLTLDGTGAIFNYSKFRYEGDQIFVFKPSTNRFFCFFFKDSKIIITNAYRKTRQKMSPEEKKKAQHAKKDYEERCKQGTYYE